MLGARERLPIDQKSDSILSLWYAIVWLAGRNPSRRTSHNTSWDSLALHDPAVDIYVVRRQIVTGLSSATSFPTGTKALYLMSESFPAHARNVSS